jgi:SAM-dependent methyltransferase
MVNPVDATRYLEFAYLLKFLSDEDVHPGNVLDVSSPVIISYMLSSMGSMVVKTDINPDEDKYVRSGPRLSFRQENATDLSFPDNSFDLVTSISVIEHIYQDYAIAMAEMIRVAKEGGLIYLTFPVSSAFTEEWIHGEIYSDQERRDNNTFFQYRYGIEEYRELIKAASSMADLVAEDIYWERREGLYDWLVGYLRKEVRSLVCSHIRAGFLNLFWGPNLFESAPGSFDKPKRFGNAQIILKKRAG